MNQPDREYAEAIFDESHNEFALAREKTIKGAYDQMMLGSARPMKALEILFDTACELVRINAEHQNRLRLEYCAEEFRERYGELMRLKSD